MPNRLADQWGSRDYPMLHRVAELLEVGGRAEVRPEKVCNDLGLAPDDAIRSMIALHRAGYIDGASFDGLNADYFIAQSVTERGRRAVGLWPGEVEVDALVQALEAAAAVAQTEDERGALRRASAELAKVGRDLMVEVAGAMLARSAGL